MRLASTLSFIIAALLCGVVLADKEETKEPAAPKKKLPAKVEDAPDAGEGREASFPKMTNLLDEAVRKLAKKRNEEALTRLKKKDYPGALNLLQQAYDLDSKDAEIANNLGYIYYLLGSSEEAEKFLREAISLDPKRHVAYINLADLLGKEGTPTKQLNEAAELLKKARELHGNRSSIILRQARIARHRGLFEDAMRFYKEYSKVRKPSNKVLVEIGDFLRELGQDDEAFAWYQKVEDTEEWGKEAASRIWEMEVERQARQYGWRDRTAEIPNKASNLLKRAHKLVGRSKFGEAKRLLDKALDVAPWFAEARTLLGDVLREKGEIEEAEFAYLRALSMDPNNSDVYLRLGELYLNEGERRRSVEAVKHLRRVIELRPDWTAVHFTLARALQRTGEMELALSHLDAFLKDVPRGKKRKEALRLKRTIEKLWDGAKAKRGPAPDKADGKTQETLSKDLVNALNKARVHLARGRLDAAMAELRRLPSGRQGSLVLNLEARILHASGRLKEAADTLNSSLKLEPKQRDVQEQLGTILLELGNTGQARRHFRRAERLGNVTAKYHVARLDLVGEEKGFSNWISSFREYKKLLAAKRRLDNFLAQSPSSIYNDDAVTLRASIDTRIWTMIAFLSGVALIFLIMLVFTTRRVWGGTDLSSLINRYPESGPEVQRVLSAVRHEVLKHNTLALGGVVESIERGGIDAAEKARRFQQSLIGGGGEDAVKSRLDKYTVELGKIGRSYGVRLNLRRKEPAISLLYQGFGLLGSVSSYLGRLPTLGPARRLRLLMNLKRAFRFLNVDGYEAVQQMLGKIRLLEVDEPLLRAIVVRVLREPAFSKAEVAPLWLETSIAFPISVLVSRSAFEDIFVNLVRNAIQSSIELGLRPVDIGLCIDWEVDEVTGFERAVFYVCDHSTKALTTEMIRGQAIEGGLGITMDLISRYDGSVDVIDGSLVPGNVGWHKAVRVKLPVS